MPQLVEAGQRGTRQHAGAHQCHRQRQLPLGWRAQRERMARLLRPQQIAASAGDARALEVEQQRSDDGRDHQEHQQRDRSIAQQSDRDLGGTRAGEQPQRHRTAEGDASGFLRRMPAALSNQRFAHLLDRHRLFGPLPVLGLAAQVRQQHAQQGIVGFVLPLPHEPAAAGIPADEAIFVELGSGSINDSAWPVAQVSELPQRGLARSKAACRITLPAIPKAPKARGSDLVLTHPRTQPRQGSTNITPVSRKSATFRVAGAAAWTRAMATVEMALVAAHLIEGFDLALAEGDALPEPVVDLALKPKQPLRPRFTRRALSAPSAPPWTSGSA